MVTVGGPDTRPTTIIAALLSRCGRGLVGARCSAWWRCRFGSILRAPVHTIDPKPVWSARVWAPAATGR